MQIEEIYYIYGFRNRKRRFVYIGKTLEPKRREGWHRGARRSLIRKKIKHCSFCILRKTNSENVYRLESQIIKALKRRGQAGLNSNIGSPNKKKVEGWLSVTILWKQRSVLFKSYAEAGRFFSMNADTLASYINSYDGCIKEGVTLVLHKS